MKKPAIVRLLHRPLDMCECQMFTNKVALEGKHKSAPTEGVVAVLILRRKTMTRTYWMRNSIYVDAGCVTQEGVGF